MLHFFLFSLLIYGMILLLVILVNLWVSLESYFSWPEFLAEIGVGAAVAFIFLVFANMCKVLVIVYNNFWG